MITKDDLSLSDLSALKTAAVRAFAEGRFQDSTALLQKAMKLAPKDPEIYYNLGVSLLSLGENDLAIAGFNAAIKLNPNDAAAFNNLGLAHEARGFIDLAIKAFERAVELDASLVEAHGNLGNMFRIQGRLDESLHCFEHARSIASNDPNVHRNLRLTRFYIPNQSSQSIFEEACNFASIHERPHSSQPDAHKNDPSTNRPIRVGYVSSDFRDHPVGHNLAPLIRNHDHERFEIYLYAEVSKPDTITSEYERLADAWRSTVGMSDEAVAETIRSDRIDILIFLAGVLDQNRVLIATQRSAPIQISYHDITTTGLKAMDHWLTDAFLHPSNTPEQYTESLLRLPRFYVYPPIDDAPEPAPSTASTPGEVTFGSFNNPAKLNSEVIALWSEVLCAVPRSRLLLKYTGIFGCPEVCETFRSKFEAHGVDPNRLAFLSQKEARSAHLSRYEQVDIALDPFPFNGATTTFEALWMGVPVVTLLGDNFRSRAAASLLHIIGYDAWIAASRQEYVELATRMASDPEFLATTRNTLREKIRSSLLCDGAAYARDIEAALRDLWSAWCKNQLTGGPSS